MHINAIKNAAFLSEVGRSEWEGSRDSAGVHIAANLKLVGGHRHGGVHSLLLLRSGNLRKNH